LYASTTGERHLGEMAKLVSDFDTEADFWGIQPAEPFYQENGGDHISRHFSALETRRHDDRLEIDEAEPLLDFILSTNAKSQLEGDRLIAFIDHVERIIEGDDKISVTKDEGLFIAQL
tara:strand:- start:106 stop:459 length:354 start_codon:yes stop_codon:yes gene_type:complete